MKKNRIKSLVALQTALALVVPSVANAFQGVPVKGNSNSSGQSNGSVGSGTIVQSQTPKTDGKTIQGQRVDECTSSSNPSASEYFPMALFNQISRDGSGLSIEVGENNLINVKIPSSISVCGKFKAELYQDDVTKNVTVKMTNDTYKTYGEYETCLKTSGILSQDGIINHAAIDGAKYSEYSYPLRYDFDKTKDVTKPIKLTYAYPRAFREIEDFKDQNGIDESVKLPNGCLGAERISQNRDIYLNEGREAILDKLNTVCKSGSAQDIAAARKSIGNYDALKDIADKVKIELDGAYLKKELATEVKAIYEAMDNIDKKLSSDHNTLDEATAKKYVKQYALLAKNLDDNFLNPAIMHLEELMKQRSALNDEDSSAKTLDDEIKRLNDDISKFAGRSATSLITLYDLMKKYSINDQAKTIEDVRLKSYLYSKVYVSTGSDDQRGKAISFDDAYQKQVKGMRNFDKTLVDWQDVYLAAHGSTAPLQKVYKIESQIKAKMDARWTNYAQSETQQYNQYCGIGMTGAVSNPVQCQAFLKNHDSRQKQQLKLRENDLKAMASVDLKRKEMESGYVDYKKSEAERAQQEKDGDLPYGSSASGQEITFEEQFPQYGTTASATPYDNWQYNPQNPAMNIGYNPQALQTVYNPGYAPGMPAQGGYAYQMQPQGMYR